MMEAKLPVIAAPNPSACGSFIRKKGGITWQPTPSKQLQFYLSEKARYWNVYKCNLSWFLIVVSD